MNMQQASNDENLTIDFYNQNATDFINGTFSADLSSLYTPFLALIRPGTHILDAGCGSGRDSLFFLQNGYRVTAFDASQEMVMYARKQTGLDVKQMSFENIDFSEQFDAIWACASLLHIPKSKINNVIKKLSRILRTGGIFYASFKYGEKEVFRNGRLFNDYTEQSFTDLIKSYIELEIISIWKTTDVRPNRDNEYWLNLLMHKK